MTLLAALLDLVAAAEERRRSENADLEKVTGPVPSDRASEHGAEAEPVGLVR